MSLGDEAIHKRPGRYDQTVLNTAFAAFILALLYVGFWHEAWADEAQAWLIARDDTLWRIVSQTARYEGTPPLWHLLLWAPAHLGFPYRCLWLISASLASCGAYILLYRSTFPVLMRVGIIFSYYFAYQFSIVARSYALDLILFPAAALVYGDRLKRPILYCAILALLANCNTHGFLLSGVLFLDFLLAGLKRRLLSDANVIIAVLLYGLLASAALAAAWPPSDISFKTNRVSGLSIIHAVLMMAEAFLERIDIFSSREPILASQLIGIILSIVLVWPTVYLFYKSKRLWLFISFSGVFLAFTAVKYGQPWHAGLLFLAWIFCLWISWENLHRLSPQRRFWLIVSISTILSVQCWDTIAAWTREVKQTYAPGEAAMSSVLDYTKIHPNTKIAGMGFKAFAIQPWTDRNLFDNFNNHTAHAAYFDWRTSQSYVAVLDISDWRKLIEDKTYDVVVLSSLDTLKTPEEYKNYRDEAAKHGFCERYFNGEMIWKTYSRENQSIAIFTRCVPAHGPVLPPGGKDVQRVF